MINKIVYTNKNTGEKREIQNQWPSQIPDAQIKTNALNAVCFQTIKNKWVIERKFPAEILQGTKPVIDMSDDLKKEFWDMVEKERKNWAFDYFK